jgi:predicted transposase/invertase (TIGR01784 family)
MSALQDKHINPLTDFGFKKLYEESLKNYRDIKNLVDTSKEEGREERTIEFARKMKNSGEPISKIVEYTGLTEKQIEEL